MYCNCSVILSLIFSKEVLEGFPWQRFEDSCLFFHVSRISHFVTRAVAIEIWKAYTLPFCPLGLKSADDASNALSSDSRSAYKIQGVRVE